MPNICLQNQWNIQKHTCTCWLNFYEYTKILYILFNENTTETYDVFITDPRRKTYLGPDFTSQTGDRIGIEYGANYGFSIKLEV